MDITTNDLMLIIGRLTVTIELLTAQNLQLTKNLEALSPKKEGA